MNGVRDKLPTGAQPMLGPDATGVGWVMQYIVADTTGTLNLAQTALDITRSTCTTGRCALGRRVFHGKTSRKAP